MYSQWLKTQFELNPDKTKADLAGELGLEPPAISKILNGTRQVKAHEYTAMRRYFGLPVDGERALEGSRRDGYVLQPLQGGGHLSDQDAAENVEWVIPTQVLSQHTNAPSGKIKIFQVKENLMEPDFRRGEHVLVDLSARTPAPPGVFVVSDGFGFLVRHCEFIPQSSPPQVKVMARAPGFLPQTLKLDDFEIVGRVIAKLHWT